MDVPPPAPVTRATLPSNRKLISPLPNEVNCSGRDVTGKIIPICWNKYEESDFPIS